MTDEAPELSRRDKRQAAISARKELRDAGIPSTGRVTFSHVAYLGGLGKISSLTGEGNLIATTEEIGLGVLSPKKPSILWSTVEWLDVEDDEVRKSRVGKVALLGPAGLLAKSKEQTVDLTVHLMDGRDVRFQIKKAKSNAFAVKAALDPIVKRAGVRWRDEVAVAHTAVAPATTVPAEAASDLVGQIRQLAELRDQGILTTEEFDAKKAELLARM